MATATLKRPSKAAAEQGTANSSGNTFSPELIGETAGKIWSSLKDEGPQQLTKLLQGLAAPRDVVLCAIGWLAREHKIAFETKGRATVISLVEG